MSSDDYGNHWLLQQDYQHHLYYHQMRGGDGFCRDIGDYQVHQQQQEFLMQQPWPLVDDSSTSVRLPPFTSEDGTLQIHPQSGGVCYDPMVDFSNPGDIFHFDKNCNYEELGEAHPQQSFDYYNAEPVQTAAYEYCPHKF